MKTKAQLTFANTVLNQTSFLKEEIKIPERLRKLRESQGFTMCEVSKLIDVKRQTYNGYEAAPEKAYHRSPSYSNLIKLADLYNVSTDYIIGLTDNPAQQNSALDVFSILENNQSIDKNTRQYIAAMLKQLLTQHSAKAV